MRSLFTTVALALLLAGACKQAQKTTPSAPSAVITPAARALRSMVQQLHPQSGIVVAADTRSLPQILRRLAAATLGRVPKLLDRPLLQSLTAPLRLRPLPEGLTKAIDRGRPLVVAVTLPNVAPMLEMVRAGAPLHPSWPASPIAIRVLVPTRGTAMVAPWLAWFAENGGRPLRKEGTLHLLSGLRGGHVHRVSVLARRDVIQIDLAYGDGVVWSKALESAFLRSIRPLATGTRRWRSTPALEQFISTSAAAKIYLALENLRPLGLVAGWQSVKQALRDVDRTLLGPLVLRVAQIFQREQLLQAWAMSQIDDLTLALTAADTLQIYRTLTAAGVAAAHAGSRDVAPLVALRKGDVALDLRVAVNLGRQLPLVTRAEWLKRLHAARGDEVSRTLREAGISGWIAVLRNVDVVAWYQLQGLLRDLPAATVAPNSLRVVVAPGWKSWALAGVRRSSFDEAAIRKALHPFLSPQRHGRRSVTLRFETQGRWHLLLVGVGVDPSQVFASRLEKAHFPISGRAQLPGSRGSIVFATTYRRALALSQVRLIAPEIKVVSPLRLPQVAALARFTPLRAAAWHVRCLDQRLKAWTTVYKAVASIQRSAQTGQKLRGIDAPTWLLTAWSGAYQCLADRAVAFKRARMAAAGWRMLLALTAESIADKASAIHYYSAACTLGASTGCRWRDAIQKSGVMLSYLPVVSGVKPREPTRPRALHMPPTLRRPPQEKTAPAPQNKPVLVQAPAGRSAVQRTISRARARFRRCFEQQLRINPKLQGKVLVKFVIGKDGTVSSASVASTSLNSKPVESCLVEHVRRLRFPGVAGPLVVVYPWIFASR